MQARHAPLPRRAARPRACVGRQCGDPACTRRRGRSGCAAAPSPAPPAEPAPARAGAPHLRPAALTIDRVALLQVGVVCGGQDARAEAAHDLLARARRGRVGAKGGPRGRAQPWCGGVARRRPARQRRRARARTASRKPWLTLKYPIEAMTPPGGSPEGGRKRGGAGRRERAGWRGKVLGVKDERCGRARRAHMWERPHCTAQARACQPRHAPSLRTTPRSRARGAHQMMESSLTVCAGRPF